MKILAILLALAPTTALAAGFDGGQLGILWAVPFAGILLSIALCPLLAPMIWHLHFGKITAAWALALLIPLLATFGATQTLHLVAHTLMLEYIPFIIVLYALFTVAGGICVHGNLHGTPQLNTALLAIGTFLASWMGTTGAAMLMIRPVIRANDNRKHKKHVIVFFIFLVANAGGALTPLGDPPLFLGFLKGVDFFWTTTHLLAPTLLVCGSAAGGRSSRSTGISTTTAGRRSPPKWTRRRTPRCVSKAKSTCCCWSRCSARSCCPASGSRACGSR